MSGLVFMLLAPFLSHPITSDGTVYCHLHFSYLWDQLCLGLPSFGLMCLEGPYQARWVCPDMLFVRLMVPSTYLFGFLCRLCLRPSMFLPCMWLFRLCYPSTPLDVQLVGSQGNGSLSPANPPEKVRFDGYKLQVVMDEKSISTDRDGPCSKNKTK